MARVSYSQYSTWHGCPQKYKLQYIDKLGETGSNIHFIFGTALHETVQHFLSVMYGVSKKQALEIDMTLLLQKNLIKEFTDTRKKQKGVDPCTQEELEEAFGDGRLALKQFTSKLTKYYSKSGFKLLGIELPLNAKIRDNVHFIGFIDVILQDISSDEIIIIDIKTSTKGWSKWQKNDKTKTSQLLLYKKFYSEKYNVSMDRIRVEYHIFKRKIDENAQYPIPRISKFVPANGKPSINMAWKGFMEFVDTVFDEDGNRRTNIDYRTNVTRLCDWCEFSERKICKDFK
jgi:hypothetical protein